MAYDDPIVFPGEPGAAHLHTFFGNTDADAFSTADSLANSGQSTCVGGILNRSAYWLPTLMDENGDPIVPASSIFYYKKKSRLHRVGVEAVAFPAGLRMVAGHVQATSIDTAGGAAYWTCRGSSTKYKTIVQTNCDRDSQLVAQINFPMCWDGRLDSPDHRSHMSYNDGDACPASHPSLIPSISMIVSYDTPAGADYEKYKQWRISSDEMNLAHRPDLGGLSLHADWFNGWNQEIVETFVDNCLNAGFDCHGRLLGDGTMLRGWSQF